MLFANAANHCANAPRDPEADNQDQQSQQHIRRASENAVRLIFHAKRRQYLFQKFHDEPNPLCLFYLEHS